MSWTQVPEAAPYALAGLLAVGAVVLATLTIRREHDGIPVRLGTDLLLPLMIIGWLLSPLVASLVTPDWSPWTMGGTLLTLWAGFGYSSVCLWRWSKGESGTHVVWRGIMFGVLPPATLAFAGAALFAF